MSASHRALLQVVSESGTWDGAETRMEMTPQALRFVVEGLEREHGPLVDQSGERLTLTSRGAALASSEAPKLFDPQ